MKAIAKSKALAPRGRSAATRARVAPAKLTDAEFRREVHAELAGEIAAARASFAKTHGHLLRPVTPAEGKARSAAARAMFAEWEKEDRKDPPPVNDWEKFKALLEANRMRSAPLFAE